MMRQDVEDVTDLVRDGRVGPVRPDFAFMQPRLSRWVALGFGAGLSPVAPGTFGTLLGWLLFVPLHRLLGDTGMAVAIAVAFGVGWWAVDRCGRDLREPDHGAIVWDEVVAFWLVLLALPHDFSTQLLAVLAFRFFDILKPAPIRWVERRWHDAWGVMLDDLVAALYAVVLVSLFVRH